MDFGYVIKNTKCKCKVSALPIIITPTRFPSYLLLSLLIYPFHLYLHRCTIPDFPSVSPQVSLSFLSCYRTTISLAAVFGLILLVHIAQFESY